MQNNYQALFQAVQLSENRYYALYPAWLCANTVQLDLNQASKGVKITAPSWL
jgi:hypothetical protein